MAPSVRSDSLERTTAATPNAEQREAVAAPAEGGPPFQTVAANAGSTKTPTRQSATARLTMSALLTVDRSWRDLKTIASSSRFPVCTIC